MLTLVLLTLGAGAPAEAATLTAPSQILRTLRPDHPRLIALPGDLARLKRLLAEDAKARAVYAQVKREAEKMLGAAPVRHELVGPRLLHQSRTCLDRVYTLATVYRLEGDRRFADRAWREMATAAAFKDWNPSHFLDTAEMTHALAIGYDWLYDFLSPEQRKTIREAIVDKGLREAEKVYRRGGWWAKSQWNWNQVCNGGISLGALAVAEDEPELAAWTVHQAVQSLPIAMKEYNPDGAWAEGPGYWNYATQYTVAMLAGLETALGTDFGLSQAPGFSETGNFRVHVVGPTGRTFNFADAGDRAGRAPHMFWLARKFDKPLWAWHERDVIGAQSALHLWWFDTRGDGPGEEPTARWFRHADVVFLRSAWADPRAVFVGFKAGDNKVNHSHLELGDFVMEADAQRWAVDLGSDDYNLPGYFGRQRWSYYRLGTEGQNTLWIDGANQDARAVAPMVAFHRATDRAHAVADLSAAYAKQVKSVHRGIALLGRRQVLIQDEIVTPSKAKIVWQMHTRAKIELQGPRAVLRQGGETLVARILCPEGAQFDTAPAAPPPPQRQQPDVRKLVVRLSGEDRPIRLAVLLVPGKAAASPDPELQPLAEWAGR